MANCEFCGKELVQIFTEMYPFHVDCLKKAIETIARHTKNLNLGPESQYTDIQYKNIHMVIRDPSETGNNYPAPKEYYSFEQAKAVAYKLCRKTGLKFLVIQIVGKVELVK
jgi:hypothetical protein